MHIRSYFCWLYILLPHATQEKRNAYIGFDMCRTTRVLRNIYFFPTWTDLDIFLGNGHIFEYIYNDQE